MKWLYIKVFGVVRATGFTKIMVIAIVSGLCLGGYAWRRAHRPMPPLEVSLWYWHTPYKIDPAESTLLHTIGVKQLFVLAGTFRAQHGAVHMILPQQWDSAPAAFGVHLVFHCDSSVIKEFEMMSAALLADSIGADIRGAVDGAEKYGVHVVGVQLDFDCATRLLARYGELMHRLRPFIKRGLALSATALPTWYTSSAIESLITQVDFLTPQYYEPTISKTLSGASTISRLSLVEHGLRAAGRHDHAFYAGIPAYGHALLYTDRGNLLGMYHDMSVVSAMRHPAFHLDRAFGADAAAKLAAASPAASTYIGEDIYDLRAVQTDASGGGLGYHLVYDLPTAELLRAHLALIAAERPRNCRGVILFRYPEAGEPSTLPLATIAAIFAGQKPVPNLKVTIACSAAPWAAVDSGAKLNHVPHDVRVTVTNTGNAGTFVAADAITLNLQFDSIGLDIVDSGGFDTAKTYLRDPGEAREEVKASPLRSNAVRFCKYYLAPGDSASTGPIETQATRVTGSWSLIGAGRLQTFHGNIADQKIDDAKP